MSSQRRTKRKLRAWQKFLIAADEDLLAFAAVYEAHLMEKAYFFAQQAIEKYLKALILKGRQRAGMSVKSRAMHTHKIEVLLTWCRQLDPNFTLPATKSARLRITRLATITRYPSRGRRFSSAEVPLFERLVGHIRGALKLRRDYYPLARGLDITLELSKTKHDWNDEARFFHNFAARPWGKGAMALRRIFANPDSIASYSPIIWKKGPIP